MTRLARAVLLGANLAIVVSIATPVAAESPRQAVHLGVGVPVPLMLYDYDASLAGSGAGVDLLLHGRLSWAHAVLEKPLLLLGLRVSGSGMKASNGEVSATGYIVALGPELSIHLPLGRWPEPKWGVGLGAGPTFCFAGFEVDENMREKTKSFGLQGRLWLDREIIGWLRVALDVGIEHSFDPIGDETFFNEPLGSSTILTFTLGPMALF